jgi:radical SAM-linked protein
MGHLDLNRMFPRAIRRAGYFPSYSQGFHPIPQLSFGPPLRLGMAGLSEVMDLRLQQQVDEQELLTVLSAQFPEGLKIRSIHALGQEAPKLSAVTGWADVFVLVSRESAEGVRPEAVEELLAKSEILIERTTKKGKLKTSNIRPGIAAVSWLDQIPADSMDLMSIRDDERMLQMRVCLQGDHRAKPEEVLLSIFDGVVPSGAQVIRRRLLPSPSPSLAISV